MMCCIALCSRRNLQKCLDYKGKGAQVVRERVDRSERSVNGKTAQSFEDVKSK